MINLTNCLKCGTPLQARSNGWYCWACSSSYPFPPLESYPKTAIKNGTPNEPKTINANGGKQSAVAYRLDLVDTGAMLALGEVLATGAETYGVDNWRKISPQDHYNHMLIHALAYLQGDMQDDHLSHMFARAMMFYATARDAERHTE